jgi:carbonic anhydrase/acetyltransferase-like protein (isoleucine patch superfamily)
VQDLTAVREGEHTPAISKAGWVAPNSALVGQVELAEKYYAYSFISASVWYGSVLRGPTTVGRNSVVQDNCVIHGATISNNVFVGPNSALGKCQLDRNAFVGMGSSVRDGAIVRGVVAAGSVVPANTVVGEGEIWAGSPAVYLRDVTVEEQQLLREHKQEVSDLALIHAQETNKSTRQVANHLSGRSSMIEISATALKPTPSTMLPLTWWLNLISLSTRTMKSSSNRGTSHSP